MNSDTDISCIYDVVGEAVSAPHAKASLITYENKKLQTRYAEYLKSRELPPGGSDISITDTVAEITTDDERVVLYYILHENVRKVSKSTISNWLNKYEIHGVNGRSIGEGGLPRPVYNVQEEGRVVVSITVNPAGQVIATSINRQTNTVNAALRKAALDAAKKARFNAVEGVNNQTGTITYYFNLR